MVTPTTNLVAPFLRAIRPNRSRRWAGLLMALGLATAGVAFAEQPPAPCHANPNAAQDEAAVRSRGDIASLPAALKDALARLGNRPHS